MKVNNNLKVEAKNPDVFLRLSTYMLMLFLAISITMVSPMLPDIISQFDLSLSNGGLIITFQGIGGLLTTLLLGVLADKFRKSRLLVTGFSLFIISLFFISITPIFSVILMLFFIYGLGSKVVDTLSNAFISDMFPLEKSIYLSILHTFFGIGALLGPMYSSYLMNLGFDWQVIFRILGLLCIFVLIFFLLGLKGVSNSNEKDINNNNSEKASIIIKDSNIWFLFLMMFLYVGHQAGISTWIPMYMESYLKANPFIASGALSIFWIGIITGRYTCFYITERFEKDKLIKWGTLTGGIILIIGILTDIPLVLITTLGLSGFLTGALMPLLIGIACDWYPGNTGAVTSILFLSLNISLMFFPWVNLN